MRYSPTMRRLLKRGKSVMIERFAMRIHSGEKPIDPRS